jgi:tRNA-2-methylthio-N6-dimethylallyladenosine synthase
MTDFSSDAHGSSMSARPRRKAYVETYGCQMNVSDGELMQGILAAQGYDLAASPEEADVVLVNTCAIREHAEQRVLGRVGELYRLKSENPDLVIGVTGCMAQRMGTRLLERAPYVDLVMGPDGYRALPQALERLRPKISGAAAVVDEVADGSASARLPHFARKRALPILTTSTLADATLAPRSIAAGAGNVALADGRLAVLAFDGEENYEGLSVRRTPGVNAWVSIQRGCDHRCTYCIVPYVRGPEKNRDPHSVLDEVRSIAEQGMTEVTLLGQTVNSYVSGDWDFPRLLRAVARVDGIRRVRFTSPHPRDVSPELVEVIATEPHVCRQLHLPAQSGSDRTLKRMLRRYTVAELLEKVDMVRAAMPDIALSTDIIVAFPGETDEEYEATLDLMRIARFDDAYLYKFSAREGTPATRLPAEQFVAADVAQARLERIIGLHREIQAQINAREVGRELEVLVERSARSPGDMLGRTEHNKVVAFPGESALLGRYLPVRLTSTTGATFRGEMLAEAQAVAQAQAVA